MALKTSERLLARIRALGVELPEGAALKPVRASRADRRNGAWSWCAVGPDGVPLQIGGYHTMAETLAFPRLEAHPQRHPGGPPDIIIDRG